MWLGFLFWFAGWIVIFLFLLYWFFKSTSNKKNQYSSGENYYNNLIISISILFALLGVFCIHLYTLSMIWLYPMIFTIIFWFSYLIGHKVIKKIIISHDLHRSINKVDISLTEEIQFYPNWSQSFSIQTDNVKKIVTYITIQLQKNEFAPEEMRWIFNHIKMYLKSDEDIKIKEVLYEQIDSFVRLWWKVIIHYKI